MEPFKAPDMILMLKKAKLEGLRGFGQGARGVQKA